MSLDADVADAKVRVYESTGPNRLLFLELGYEDECPSCETVLYGGTADTQLDRFEVRELRDVLSAWLESVESPRAT